METTPPRAIKEASTPRGRGEEAVTPRMGRDGLRVRGRRQGRCTLQDFLKSFNLKSLPWRSLAAFSLFNAPDFFAKMSTCPEGKG